MARVRVREMEVGWFGGRRMKVRAPLKDLLAGGSKRVSAPQAAKTHDALHADPRAARRGSAGEQTGGGPKARTEGGRE